MCQRSYEAIIKNLTNFDRAAHLLTLFKMAFTNFHLMCLCLVTRGCEELQNYGLKCHFILGFYINLYMWLLLTICYECFNMLKTEILKKKSPYVPIYSGLVQPVMPTQNCLLPQVLSLIFPSF